MHDLIPRHLELDDAKLFSRPSMRNVIFNCPVSGKTLSLWCTVSYKKFDWSFVWLQCP